jgi:hypothetical protein
VTLERYVEIGADERENVRGMTRGTEVVAICRRHGFRILWSAALDRGWLNVVLNINPLVAASRPAGRSTCWIRRACSHGRD